MSILFIIGIVTVILAILDIIWTILWVEGGAGFITKTICKVTWWGVSRLAHGNRKALRLIGPALLTLTLFNWIFLLWVGWTLVFLSHSGAIVDTVNQTPIIWQNVVYYTGYTLFTLGLGDYAPGSPLWQILTALASGTGMLFFTLGASYIISVVGAVLDKRSFSSSINEIGGRSETIVIDAWNGTNTSRLDLLLLNLSDHLSVLSMKQTAYPLLNYFHTTHKEKAIAIALPIIDDALSLIVYGMGEETHPNPVLVKKFRKGIGNHLDTLQETYVTPAETPLSLPNIQALKEAGLPVAASDVFERRMTAPTVVKRRRQLLGLLHEDNWQENDLHVE